MNRTLNENHTETIQEAKKERAKELAAKETRSRSTKHVTEEDGEAPTPEPTKARRKSIDHARCLASRRRSSTTLAANGDQGNAAASPRRNEEDESSGWWLRSTSVHSADRTPLIFKDPWLTNVEHLGVAEARRGRGRGVTGAWWAGTSILDRPLRGNTPQSCVCLKRTDAPSPHPMCGREGPCTERTSPA